MVLSALAWKRSNGIFYTPPIVARALASWAIRSPNDRVFDPSFGGCAFLQAAYEALRSVGATNPASCLWGIDADPSTQAAVQRFHAEGASPSQFATADFLTVEPESLSATPFTVALANPPYVRHHRLNKAKRAAGAHVARQAGVRISARASQWAYFVVHLMKFIAPGGRAVFVLPGSFLTADYATVVRRTLSQGFRSLTALLVEDRLFDDAQESTVLVFGEGRGETPAEVRVGLVTGSDVLGITPEQVLRLSHPIGVDEVESRWIKAITAPDAIRILMRVAENGYAIELGDVASIGIGTVTGNNSFFVINRSVMNRLELPECCVSPLVTHVAQLSGLRMTSLDVKQLVDSNKQVLLVTVSNDKGMPAGLKAYLAEGEHRGVSQSYKCSRRTPWYAVPVTLPPDAFLPYMMGHAPRLVINEAGVTCTNTILRINWTASMLEEKASALALGSLSTLTQLSAELVGRVYGGGVLKLEPSDATRLLIPYCPVEAGSSTRERVHQLLVKGHRAQATAFVDQLLERTGVLLPGEGTLLREALTQVQRWRKGSNLTDQGAK